MARIILNKENLFHNLDEMKKITKDINKIGIVLKDNAYGHGLIEISSLLQEYGIKKAIVQKYGEAKKIKEYFDDILILADTNIKEFSDKYHITLNSLDDLANIPNYSNVHIKVDSGMHRNGINLKDLEKAILGLINKDCLITGVFTHHRNADEISCEYFWQKQNFKEIKEKTKELCKKYKLPTPSFHSCNSAALFRTKEFNEDWCRAGIATYGYLEDNTLFEGHNLKPVLSLWAKKLCTRKIKKGQKVGYGGTYKAKNDMIASTYAVGYGDGFLRINEHHKKYFTPKGFELLGRVSMDNISLNTDEDFVCIFDDVRTLAKMHNTINYEILTSLKDGIPKEIK